MVGVAVWLFAAALLYVPVLVKLAADWSANATYSHGFVVLPIALYLVWLQRNRLTSTPPHPSLSGLLILAFGLGLFVVGTVGAELFLTRLSIVAVLAGTVVYVFGWAHLHITAFPLAFLLFMIPLPTILFDHVAVSLQLVASRLGEHLLRAADVPVLRDGNLLTLPNVTLEVNDACSGIRSLMALISITALVGYLSESRLSRRALIVLAAVPLAIGLNGVRIALTGLAATRFGPKAADGPVHAAAGWLVFVAALGCVWALQLLMRTSPDPPMRTPLGAT